MWIDRARQKSPTPTARSSLLKNFSKEELRRFLDETSNDDIFEDFTKT